MRSVPRSVVPWLLTLLLALACASCGGSGGGTDLASPDAPDAPGTPDTGADTAPVDGRADLPSDAPAVPDPDGDDVAVCAAECPAGYCDAELGCLYCETDVACPDLGWWCNPEHRCVQTLCHPGRTDCDGQFRLTTCSADGTQWEPTDCPEGQACAFGECASVICELGDERCSGQLLQVCDPSETYWKTTYCPPGHSCPVDHCVPYRHNVMLLFDTSGSMASITNLDVIPCICAEGCPGEPFPLCEQLECPRSKLGLAKLVFSRLFATAASYPLNLTLLHFPLSIMGTPPQPLPCSSMTAFGTGWYGKSMNDPHFMHGDDADEHETTPGGWFDKYLYEILSVPFPSSPADDTLAKARLWVNGNEALAPTETPCATADDCPGGLCYTSDGANVCWYHSDPELRAFGGTPLGRSLFYAGEYYRRFVIAEGRACTTDADCWNANYTCVQGTCHDPYRACRENVIVILTDGAEDPKTSTSQFSNPVVQAKRFRYGLGCTDTTACNDPAFCAQGVCGGFAFPNDGGSSGSYLPFKEGQGHDRLVDLAGNPIRITTHVIDMSPSGEAEAVARAISDNGGGVYVKADTGDPDAILAALLSMVDVKQNLGDCLPELPEASGGIAR